MKRRITTCLFALSTAVIACSGSDPDRKSPNPGPGHVTPDPKTPKGLSATCSVTQADAFGPISGSDVVATTGNVFLAKPRALFRADTSAIGEPPVLHPIGGFPEGKGPDSVASLGDTLFANVSTDCDQWSCKKNRIVVSTDQGQSWQDIPGIPGELQVGAQLHVNETFLLATDFSGALATYDFATKTWTHLHPTPVDGSPGDHMVASFLGFEGTSIVANDVYGGGVVYLPYGGSQWLREEGLSEWGYAGWVSREGVTVTSNMSGMFVKTNGVWEKSFLVENNGLAIADAGDSFLAADHEGKLFRSTDGIAWKVVAEHPEAQFHGQSTLVKNGSIIVWLGPGLQLSHTNGNTWQAVSTVVEDVPQVHALGDRVFVRDPFQWQSWNGSDSSDWAPAFESATWVSFGKDGVYTCG
jgi:hypothetical protein